MNVKRLSIEGFIRFFVSTVAAGLFIIGTSTALAANAHSHQMAPSKEMRHKMAAVHEQMAACLRSNKAIRVCRQEMMNSCHSMMGDEGCSMMMGMGGMGYMRSHGTQNSSHAAHTPPK